MAQGAFAPIKCNQSNVRRISMRPSKKSFASPTRRGALNLHRAHFFLLQPTSPQHRDGTLGPKSQGTTNDDEDYDDLRRRRHYLPTFAIIPNVATRYLFWLFFLSVKLLRSRIGETSLPFRAPGIEGFLVVSFLLLSRRQMRNPHQTPSSLRGRRYGVREAKWS